MKHKSQNMHCADCDHAVVSGVACDWQPDLCPYCHQIDREQRAQGFSGIQDRLVAFAEAVEFDAVLGSD